MLLPTRIIFTPSLLPIYLQGSITVEPLGKGNSLKTSCLVPIKNRFGFFQENLSIASSKLQSRYGSQILQFIFSSSKAHQTAYACKILFKNFNWQYDFQILSKSCTIANHITCTSKQ